mmetsp:Transcript_21738/g.62337  ORF Transcript_21738/g.62337 Transcript_21738/m.62337 type:complete len:511 (-) Transcript_21738:330-1862(-)|eukprot:CAMPEP_0181037566 /NCGR_PEP_ID=MMETSP1070-20121207/9471_1 /TAXON_ID=265543 /ORGANISM="Minutocellus polymorphus, Strain NH13" /LENGTH=510 /DNA_ID=CAMNT_0023115293 /DNA_START=414 /DNA_END=1946 /DNA_ORIENTATION=+
MSEGGKRVTGMDCLQSASKDSDDENDDAKAGPTSTCTSNADTDDIASFPLEIRNGPHITDAVQELEFNYASEDERARAQADMYGLPPAGSAYGDQVLAERAAASVEAALNRIPPAERVAQLKAQIAHPFLLSCPRHVLPFLEAEDRDVAAAARRIVRYWDGRERVLGEEAFSAESFAQYPLTDEDRGRLYSRGFQSTPDAKVNDALRAAVVKALSAWLLEKIETMEREIEALAPKRKAALVEAKERDPDVLEEGRVIEFLESEEYNTKRAAERMASYWDMKTYLFGKDDALRDDAHLLRSIQDDCRKELDLGILYVLPRFDKYGRGIVMLRADKTPVDREAQLRLLKVFWFVMTNVMTKTSARRHGVVFICHIGNLRNTQANNLEFLTRWAQLNFHCIPLRTCAFHDCIPPHGRWFRNLFLPFFMWIIQRSARMRFIVHDEEPGAMPEILETYGIKKEQLPGVIGGTLDKEYPSRWTEENLRGLEEESVGDEDEVGVQKITGREAEEEKG